MPLTLYRLPKSSHFSPNAIAHRTVGETRSDVFTLVPGAGTCGYDSGTIDMTANHHKVALPLPFNTDRSDENENGWCLGDLAKVIGNITTSSIHHGFPSGALVQFVDDDRSPAPKWQRVDGGTDPQAQYVDYRDVERLSPVAKPQPPRQAFLVDDTHDYFTRGSVVMHGPDDGTVYTVLYGTARWNNGIDMRPGAIISPDSRRATDLVPLGPLPSTNKPTNSCGWRFGDLGLVIEHDARFLKGSVVRLSNDDGSPCPYFDLVHGAFTPGRENGIASTNQRCMAYTKLQRLDPSETITTATPTAPEETTPMSHTPFNEGDRVVPNGFRAGSNGQHARGTVPVMGQWEANKAVLTVIYATSDGIVSVRGADGGRNAYHPSELRVALDEEVAKADTPPVPKQQPLTTGSVILPADGGSAMIVNNPTPDSDGDITVLKLSSTTDRYFKLGRGYTLLGQIMPDGDYRPAAAVPAQPKPSSEWRPGDVVRLDRHKPYMTIGREYTIEYAPERDMIRVRDDDADLAPRLPTGYFTFVRSAA